MNARFDRALVLALMLASVGLGGLGCRKQERSSMPASEEASAFAEPPPGDALAELDQLEQRMRGLGLTPASPRRDARDAGGSTEGHEAELDASAKVGGDKSEDVDDEAGIPTAPIEPQTLPRPIAERNKQPSPAGAGEAVSRCESVCELSETICELEVRICSMSEHHRSDPLYADACERAVDDCELSGDACDTCVE